VFIDHMDEETVSLHDAARRCAPHSENPGFPLQTHLNRKVAGLLTVIPARAGMTVTAST
jgi:hypothetical protein